MGKKSLRLGQRIIAIHPRSIDGNIADNRPISSSIVVTNWGSILTKNYILNPVQAIFNSPMSSESPQQTSLPLRVQS